MPVYIDLFSGCGAPPSIAVTDDVSGLLSTKSPVAIGVSGGKDSCAVAFATVKYLDSIGHKGPRVLIHADLGLVEWQDSLPTCHRLSEALGMELIVVRRPAGGMMERWEGRWQNNLRRYRQLECVKLILPWSTPSMRFCTSELKTTPICQELTVRFPGSSILSVTGIRREESSTRAKSPISQPQKRLEKKTAGTTGFDWHPIADWKLPDVFHLLRVNGFRLHEAYTLYQSSRVSCAYCILGSEGDLRASASCPENHGVYRRMAGLEAISTFSFQDSKWLGDVAPHLLSSDLRDQLADAKVRAARRTKAEARIPNHLLYTKDWPTCIPTIEESQMLAEVRNEVSSAVGIPGMEYLDADQIRNRYAELIEIAIVKGKRTTENRFAVAPNTGNVSQTQMMIEEATHA